MVEEGGHQELIAKKGLYYNLVTTQEGTVNNKEGSNFSFRKKIYYLIFI